MANLRTVVGIDISMGATGVVVIRGRLGTPSCLLSSWVCSAPESDKSGTDKGFRLCELGNAVSNAIGDETPDEIFIEGYSFGSPHAARRIAETHGAIHAMLWREYGARPHYVPPASAKKAACPDHPGWSKANWEAAGKKGPWKRAMPDKVDVIRGVHKNFGLSLATDAEADALCVAVAGVRSTRTGGGLFLLETTRHFIDRRIFAK